MHKYYDLYHAFLLLFFIARVGVYNGALGRGLGSACWAGLGLECVGDWTGLDVIDHFLSQFHPIPIRG